MLLTQSSKQTELEAIMPHRDSMRGNSERGLTRRPWPLLSWWGIRVSLGPQSQGPLALSHSLSATAMLGSREREKEWLLKQSSRERQQIERRASFVPKFIPVRRNQRALFVSLCLSIDCERRTWADARSLAGYSILGAVSQGRLKRIDS